MYEHRLIHRSREFLNQEPQGEIQVPSIKDAKKPEKTEYHLKNEKKRREKSAIDVLPSQMPDLMKSVEKEVEGVDSVKLVRNEYTSEELLKFFKKSQSPLTKSVFIQHLSIVTNGNIALNDIKELLSSNDTIVYGSALAFMIKYGSKEDIPMYLQNLDDMMSTVLKAEDKTISEYDDKVATSREQALKTGKGGKAYLLIEKPEERKDFLLQYGALIGGYGSALERGSNTLPQFKNIFEKSELGYPALMVGLQLIEASKFEEIQTLFTKSNNKTKQNALLAAMQIGMTQNTLVDKKIFKNRVEAIRKIGERLLTSDVKIDDNQKKILEKMKAEQIIHD